MKCNILVFVLVILSNAAYADVTLDMGNHKYSWSEKTIAIDGVTIYQALAKKSFEDDGCTGGESLEVLSVVGNIISFRVVGGSSCPLAAYPNYWNDIKVMRLEDGQPSFVSLNDLFPMDSIISALAEDKWIKGKYGNSPKQFLRNRMNPRTPNQCEEISRAALSSFSFHHVNKNKVAVRIHIPNCLHNVHPKILGLYLNIPKSMHKNFKEADNNSLLENKIKTHNKSLNSTPKSGAN